MEIRQITGELKTRLADSPPRTPWGNAGIRITHPLLLIPALMETVSMMPMYH